MTIQAPNYTQVPNAILDRIHEMTLAEWKIVGVVCRLTFGWHKREEVVTLSRLETLTGLSRTSVLDGIVAAMDRGILGRRKLGAREVAYYLLVASDSPSAETIGSPTLPTATIGSPTLPITVASDYQSSVASDYHAPLLKKDLKKLKENVVDARARAEPPPPTILELTENHDAGDADFDPVEALIEIDFTPVQAVDAQTAYRAAEIPLDLAEVARIARYIAEPPARIQKPAGYLASKWRNGKVEPLVPPPIKHAPAWDTDTQRFEPQPADIPQTVIDQARQLRAELDSNQDAGRPMIDERALAALNARQARPVLKSMPAKRTFEWGTP